MNFLLERTAEPEIEPITLAEMKRHLRLFDDITSEDNDVSGLITVAREWVEEYTGRALIDQTWRLTVEDYTTGVIMLRRSPVLAVLSMVSVDAEGAETTIDASTYEVREAASRWPTLVPLSGATWPTGVLRITFRAGFADRTGSPQQDGSVVPAVIKQAMKLVAAHYYDNRAPVNIGNITTELPLGIKFMLASQRCNFNFA